MTPSRWVQAKKPQYFCLRAHSDSFYFIVFCRTHDPTGDGRPKQNSTSQNIGWCCAGCVGNWSGKTPFQEFQQTWSPTSSSPPPHLLLCKAATVLRGAPLSLPGENSHHHVALWTPPHVRNVKVLVFFLKGLLWPTVMFYFLMSELYFCLCVCACVCVCVCVGVLNGWHHVIAKSWEKYNI